MKVYVKSILSDRVSRRFSKKIAFHFHVGQLSL